jgi:hypothetical protein
VHCCYRYQRRCIDNIQHAVNALQKIPHALCRIEFLHRLRALVQLAQIRTGAKSRFHLAINNERMSLPFYGC